MIEVYVYVWGICMLFSICIFLFDMDGRKNKPMKWKRGLDIFYQDDFLTPGSSPLSALRRNWNRHRRNSRNTPDPWPVSKHRLRRNTGEDCVGREFKANWAWWRVRAGRDSLRVIYRYAWRTSSLLATAVRACMSRRIRLLIVFKVEVCVADTGNLWKTVNKKCVTSPASKIVAAQIAYGSAHISWSLTHSFSPSTMASLPPPTSKNPRPPKVPYQKQVDLYLEYHWDSLI